MMGIGDSLPNIPAFHSTSGSEMVSGSISILTASNIIGLDIYANPLSSMSSEWENVQNRFNNVKLITLSESGTLPDLDTMKTYGI